MANDKNGDEIKKTFAEMKRQQREINAGAKQLEESLAKQLEMQNDILKIRGNIQHLDEKRLKLEEDLKDELKTKAKWDKIFQEARKKGDKNAQRDALEELKSLRTKIQLQKTSLEVTKDNLNNLNLGLETMKKTVKESNKLRSSFNSMKGAVKTWGWDKLKEWGVFEMDKAIRDTSKSMGLGRKNAQAMADGISTASETTIMMGAGIKNLAKMQAGYSKEIGRSVKLTQEGHIAMAGLSEGTGLGESFAVGMAAGMDNFGVSVEASADLVEETMNMAGEMGVNSAKAAETLKKSLKFAQKFHFKGGVKGLAKMAVEAERLKLDMDGIAGLAEKVFRPEGAVEMAAKLQTMGGAFSQMANPMQMMFEARNDPAKFAKKIGAATSEFVEYNKETKTFDVKGGLAADRMREISTMTGIAVEKLQEMAVQQKKIETVGSVSPFSFSKEEKELVSGMAEMKDGKWQVNVGGDLKAIKNLKKGDLKLIREEKQNLKDRAEQSRNFQDVIEDIWLQIQSTLLPVAQALKDNIGTPLQKFTDKLSAGGKDSFIGSIKGWIKSIANFVTGIGKVASFLGPTGVLAAFLGIKAAQWIINGRMLGMGFNMVASAGRGVGGAAGASSSIKGPGGGVFGKVGSGLSVGKNLGRAAKSGGAVGGGVLAAGFAGYNEYQENKEMGMDGKENAGRTAAKGISAGLGAWGGAAAGAAIGSVVPVIGTVIGGLIGGAIGAYGGGALGEAVGDAAYGNESGKGKNSGVGKSLGVADAMIQFNENDNFGLANGGATLVASTSKGQINKAAETLQGGGKGSNVKIGGKAIIEIIVKSDSKATVEEVKKALGTAEIQRELNTTLNSLKSSVMAGKQTVSPV